MKQEEHLDFGGGIESHCIDTLEQVGLQVELFKTFHRVKRTIWVLALDLQIILVLHQALPDHLLQERLFSHRYVVDSRGTSVVDTQPVHLFQSLFLRIGCASPVHVHIGHGEV
jgi:hypothetical protein